MSDKPNFLEMARNTLEGKMCNKNALFVSIVESLVTIYELGKLHGKQNIGEEDEQDS